MTRLIQLASTILIPLLYGLVRLIADNFAPEVWYYVIIEVSFSLIFGGSGRMSGVEGTMPLHVVMTVRDGKISRLEYYPDHESAVAAARGA